MSRTVYNRICAYSKCDAEFETEYPSVQCCCPEHQLHYFRELIEGGIMPTDLAVEEQSKVNWKYRPSKELSDSMNELMCLALEAAEMNMSYGELMEKKYAETKQYK